EVGDIRTLRKHASVDLDDRTHEDDLPVRSRIRQHFDQIEIDALVDDAVIAEARTGQGSLVRRVRAALPGLREMPRVDARWEWMHRWMTLPFGLVEAVSAGEDEIGEIEQFALERYEIGRRKPKIREFVHAVVDCACSLQMARVGEHHRRIIP